MICRLIHLKEWIFGFVEKLVESVYTEEKPGKSPAEVFPACWLWRPMGSLVRLIDSSVDETLPNIYFPQYVVWDERKCLRVTLSNTILGSVKPFAVGNTIIKICNCPFCFVPIAVHFRQSLSPWLLKFPYWPRPPYNQKTKLIQQACRSLPSAAQSVVIVDKASWN